MLSLQMLLRVLLRMMLLRVLLLQGLVLTQTMLDKDCIYTSVVVLGYAVAPIFAIGNDEHYGALRALWIVIQSNLWQTWILLWTLQVWARSWKVLHGNIAM